MKIINAQNFVDHHSYDGTLILGEVNNSPSLTVPNMTLSLEDLIKRYVRGDDVTVFEGVFTGDDDLFDGVERMDSLDRLDLARHLDTTISDIRSRRKTSVPLPEPSPTLLDHPDPSM